MSPVQRPAEIVLDLSGVTDAVEHEVHADLCGEVLHPLECLHEEIVGKRWDDDGDRVRTAGGKALGSGVGLIVQPLHERKHTCAGPGRNMRVVVETPRHCSYAHTGFTGKIVDRNTHRGGAILCYILKEECIRDQTGSASINVRVFQSPESRKFCSGRIPDVPTHLFSRGPLLKLVFYAPP